MALIQAYNGPIYKQGGGRHEHGHPGLHRDVGLSKRLVVAGVLNVRRNGALGG